MLGIALGGLLILGACGDDDEPEADAEDTESGSENESESNGGSDADAYIEALAASLQEDEDLSIDEETARCTAAAGVNTVGVDALEAADVTPEELAEPDSSLESLGVEIPDDAALDMSAALQDCNLGETFAQVLVDSFASEETVQMPEDAATCIADNIDEEALSMLLANSFVTGGEGSDEDFSALFGAPLAACPAVLSELLIGGMAAESGTEIPQSARDCVTTYVEANAQAVSDGLMGGSSEELFTGLTAACPELAALAPGGG